MSKIKQKLHHILTLSVCTLFIGSIYTGETINKTIDACTTTEECQAQIAASQQKRAELVKQQQELEGKSSDTKTQVENVMAQLNTYQTELTVLDIEMTNLKSQQAQLEQSINDNDQNIRTRLIMTQLSMETDEAVQFLANASSITEMIERMQTVSDLTESNQNIIKTLEAQKAELVKNEQKQKERKAQVDQLVAEQEQLKASKKAELDKYNADIQSTTASQAEVSKQISLSQQQMKQIEAERAKARELERLQIEAAKRAAQQAAQKAQQSGSAAPKPVEPAPIPSTPIPSNGTALQNERAAFKYFISQGYTRAAAAGIIGNFYVESGMDPTKKQYFGGPGRGLAQWGYNADGGRFNDLITYARKQNKSEWALDTQLNWTVYELSTYSWFRNLNTALKSTNDISYATYYFGDVFEGPANLSASINERVRYANTVFNRN